MKAVLIFNLPDDEFDHNAALRGKDYLSVLRALAEQLRGRLKYGELGNEAMTELQDISRTLYELVPDIYDG